MSTLQRDGRRILLTDEERAVFRAAADLAARLRKEAFDADRDFGSFNATVDRPLFEMEYGGRYLAVLGWFRLSPSDPQESTR